jgi:hypothetical protein
MTTRCTFLRLIFGLSIVFVTISNYYFSFRMVGESKLQDAPTLIEFLNGTISRDTRINGKSPRSRRNDQVKNSSTIDSHNTSTYLRDSGLNKNTVTVGKVRTLENMKTDGTCLSLDDPTAMSVSLVIHSTVERLWLLQETCRRWQSPIVLVVYYQPKRHNRQSWAQALDWKKACPKVKIVPVAATNDEEEWEYPVNKLRNVGIDALETTHFLMVDVDFLPSGDLQSAIQQNFFTKFKSDYNQKVAMVVPAFERFGTCETVKDCQMMSKKKGKNKFIPYSYKDIVGCVKVEDCGVFHAVDFLEGHLTTASDSWLKGEFFEGDIPRKIQCFTSFKYEPYVVLRKCQGVTPYYDERFYGYGKNKIEYISHLRFLNYSFHVLPEGYLIHYPHPKSKANRVFLRERKYRFREKMDNLYEQFLAALNTTHGEPILGECKVQPQLSM